jgi:hypothetical protein
MDVTQITKCEFEEVYNKYAPSKIEKFYFKYFSQSTLQKNKWASWVVAGVMFIPFLFAFIGTVSNASQKLIGISTYIFSGLLVCFAIPWIFVWFMHNCRIKKIQKKLGVNQSEYEYLIDKFYNEDTIVKYIKNKACK